jgi:Co/Zn/Cd efflux system component
MSVRRDSKPSDEDPGVPGFRRWNALYAFVFGIFLLVVALLALVSWWFR